MNEKERKMKCDELTIYHSKNLGLPVYLKSEVDEAIAEKDKVIAELKDRYKDMDMAHTVHIAKMNDKIEEQESEIAELKATCVYTDNSAVIESMANELERLRPMETALELAEADNKGYLARIKTLEAKNRRLERALWLARAELCRRLDVDRYLRNHRNSLYNEEYLTFGKAITMELKMCKAESKCRAKAKEFK